MDAKEDLSLTLSRIAIEETAAAAEAKNPGLAVPPYLKSAMTAFLDACFTPNSLLAITCRDKIEQLHVLNFLLVKALLADVSASPRMTYQLGVPVVELKNKSGILVKLK